LTAPVSDESITNDRRLKIDIAPVDPADDGGAPILSYSLELDDGQGGQFVAVYGKEVDSLSTSYYHYTDVQRGNLYRTRYRVKNVIGWSDYSPISFVLAAIPPN